MAGFSAHSSSLAFSVCQRWEASEEVGDVRNINSALYSPMANGGKLLIQRHFLGDFYPQALGTKGQIGQSNGNRHCSHRNNDWVEAAWAHGYWGPLIHPVLPVTLYVCG